MRNRIFKRIAGGIAAVLVFFVFLAAYFPALPVRAAGLDLNFDKTDVMTDLKSSTVNGKAFNLIDYPFDATGLVKKPAIINFVEYCYSFKVNMQDNYGLYVYFYNPQALNLDTASRSNKIQLAVAYDADGIPSSYEKFELIFCSKAEDRGIQNLFYKFKVKDRISSDGKTVLQRVNSNERRYDVSGVELAEKSKPNAVDYKLGATYKFSGYAKGYGPDPDTESDLQCEIDELETVVLEVKNTFFRTNASAAGKDHQNELNSVYFSVDKSLLAKYGRLQRVKAEWYEYKTTPVAVTSHAGFYDTALGYMGMSLGSNYNSSLGYSLYYNLIGDILPIASWGWNRGGLVTCPINLPALYYLFYSSGLGEVPGKKIAEYIYGYTQSYEKGRLDVKSRQISADLFVDAVDKDRDRGYNLKEIDAGDKFNMLSYDSAHSGWTRFWQYFGNWGVETGGDYFGISPIHEVTDEDLSGADAAVSSRIFVNRDDLKDFKEDYNKAKEKDKATFLFRFAQTDYYSVPLTLYDPKAGIFGTGDYVKNKAYCFQETVFLDFDIIELTFYRDGVYRVIPVVSSPIDIINSGTPPLKDETTPGILQLILMIAALVLIVVLIVFFWPFIERFILWLFGLIKKILQLPGKLIRSAKKSAKKEGKK